MTEQEVLDVLKQACKEQRVCQAQFLNNPALRTIHPHGVCHTRKKKRIIVCVQVAGYSESDSLPQFRNLLFHKCERIEMLSQRFKVHPDFDPNDPQYENWLFHV